MLKLKYGQLAVLLKPTIAHVKVFNAHRSKRPAQETAAVIRPLVATTKIADTTASVVARADWLSAFTAPAAKLKSSLRFMSKQQHCTRLVLGLSGGSLIHAGMGSWGRRSRSLQAARGPANCIMRFPLTKFWHGL